VLALSSIYVHVSPKGYVRQFEYIVQVSDNEQSDGQISLFHSKLDIKGCSTRIRIYSAHPHFFQHYSFSLTSMVSRLARLGRCISERNSRIIRSRRESIHPIPTQQRPHIHRMPPEILCEIFLLYILNLAEQEEEDLLSQAYDKSGPYLLTQTCSRWRNIALDFPPLWDFIYIDVEAFENMWVEPKRASPITENVALEVFKRRVDCAGNKLEINIVFNSLNLYTSSALLAAIFEVLPRCWVFRMIINQHSIPVDPFLMLHDKRPNFPALEYLDLQFDGDGSHLSHIQYLFNDAPLLSNFEWHEESTVPIIHQFSLPWAQLSTVKLVLRDCDFPVLLQLCPNLCSVVYWPYDDGEAWVNPSEFTHDKLKYLDIGYSTWKTPRIALEMFLTKVRLPQLNHFEISGADWKDGQGRFPVDDTLAYSLLVFLKNSSPRNLRVLHLLNMYLHDHFMTLVKALSMFPRLRVLAIGFRRPEYIRKELSKRFVSWFTARSIEVIQTPFLPDLQSFYLKFPCLSDVDGILYTSENQENIVEMIKSRRDARIEDSGLKPLKKFVMHWDCGFTVYPENWMLEDVGYLRKLAVEGQFEVEIAKVYYCICNRLTRYPLCCHSDLYHLYND
jgi:hypothetical protein